MSAQAQGVKLLLQPLTYDRMQAYNEKFHQSGRTLVFQKYCVIHASNITFPQNGFLPQTAYMQTLIQEVTRWL